jgi:chemotaxis protein MotB
MGLQRRHLLNRQIQGSKPVNQGWQIVYTGFVLIMLSLFILLTSFASLDPSKITQFVDSFSNAVSVLSGGKSIQKSRTFLPTQVDALSKQDLTAELFEQVRRFSEEEELDQVHLHRSDQGVVMTLIDNLLFDSGKTDLTRDAYPLLRKIARLIDHVRVPVEIGGHTDDRPIQTALFPSNWELSTARAVSVLRYLIEHHGVDAQRLSAVGFAHYQPLSVDDGPLHHAMNRRVEFVFLVEQ